MFFDPQYIPHMIALSASSGLILGALISYLWCSKKHKTRVLELQESIRSSLAVEAEKQKELELTVVALEAKQLSLVESAHSSKQELKALTTKLENEVKLKHQALQQSKVIEAQLSERETNFKTQLQQFELQKQDLKKEFELLAHKIFEEKGKSFDERSKTQMDAVLKPFKDQIDGFQKRVNEVHTESVQGNSKLEAQIKNVLEVGMKMSGEAQSLAQALKGDKKAQGNWSEVQAELLLEMSGLSEGREYEREANYKTEDGKDQRPDFVVNLPNDKHIIIDSKISLNAYVNAVASEVEEEQQQYLNAHVEAIRTHVRTLSDKNYAKLKGINSPEYIFMFMGSEPAYLAAANQDPSLFQDAYRKGIAIVTPNTLLSSLRIVSHLWSIDKQNANTRQLAEQASKVHDKLRVFAEKMQKLGAQISTAQRTYEDSWNTLKDGRGSLAKQVDKFVEMGVSVKESLPSAVTSEEIGHAGDKLG